LLRCPELLLTPGRVTAILGPNGAGKSTLLSVLAGTRNPDAGQVLLRGLPLREWPVERLARSRAVVPQHTHLAFDFTVRDLVELGRYPHRGQASSTVGSGAVTEQAMALAGLSELQGRSLRHLSGGEQARAHLARAMAQIWPHDHPAALGVRTAALPLGVRTAALPPQDAPWLLLDEPTAALDLMQQHRLLGLVRDWSRQHGVGVVVVLHDLNLALRFADEAVLLTGGEVVAHSSVASVLTPRQIEQVWGVQAQPTAAVDGTPQCLFQLA
jgi:iron complex transport system ATP-binding protein